MTCYDNTQEKITSVGIKEEMMPDPENLSELDKDDKENKKRELDVKQLEEPASEESIGDMVVIHHL